MSTIHTYTSEYIPAYIPFARFEAFDIVNWIGEIALLQLLCMVSAPFCMSF